MSCWEPLAEPHLGSWGRPGMASVTGCGVMRHGNKQLRTKGKTESWMSLQNSPGSRKVLDKRKTNTMNLSERLPWVCWAQVCLGTNPSDSPSSTLVGSSHCVPALLASAQVTSSQGGAQARPSPSTTHHLQLELSSFLRKHDVMNLAEHLIKSTNTTDASVAGSELLPCLCPVASGSAHTGSQL